MKISQKNYNEESDKIYFLKTDVQYLEQLHDLHEIYNCYLKEWKLKKAKKLVANLYNKTEYVIHIRNLKQALNHGWVLLKKVNRVIKSIKMFF